VIGAGGFDGCACDSAFMIACPKFFYTVIYATTYATLAIFSRAHQEMHDVSR
jgi:hypothetical protein